MMEYWSIGVLERVQMKMQMRREIILRIIVNLTLRAVGVHIYPNNNNFQ
jgi:hypothetical protein